MGCYLNIVGLAPGAKLTRSGALGKQRTAPIKSTYRTYITPPELIDLSNQLRFFHTPHSRLAYSHFKYLSLQLNLRSIDKCSTPALGDGSDTYSRDWGHH